MWKCSSGAYSYIAGYSIKYLLRFEMKKYILFHNIIYFTSHNIYNIIIFYIHKLFIPKTQPRWLGWLLYYTTVINITTTMLKASNTTCTLIPNNLEMNTITQWIYIIIYTIYTNSFILINTFLQVILVSFIHGLGVSSGNSKTFESLFKWGIIWYISASRPQVSPLHSYKSSLDSLCTGATYFYCVVDVIFEK